MEVLILNTYWQIIGIAHIIHHLRLYLLDLSGEGTGAALLFRHGSCWHWAVVGVCLQCSQQLLMGITRLPQIQGKAGGLPGGKPHCASCRGGGNAVELVLPSSSCRTTARAQACWRGSAKFLLQRAVNNRFQEEPWVFLPRITTQEGQGSKSYKVALAVVIIAMTTHGLLEGRTVVSLLSSACSFSSPKATPTVGSHHVQQLIV